ncbi:MAG: LytTR family DNA-binding domain-containing protein [Oscillospiraceae bacterium]|nr:LytTR family DNA-binding domain-containing protein [Oscillospiraceae bacterium]
MINIAVCDDNKAFLDMMCRLVDEMMTEAEIPHKIRDYLSGCVFLDHHKLEPFDVVFLDIIMPQKSGFEIADEMRKISEKTYIIFVTTEDSLVYDSFDFTPFYFVPKSNPKLLKTKLHHVIEKLAAHISANKPIYIEMAFGEKRYIEPSTIVLISSNANYVDYTLSSGEVLHIRGKLEETESLLDTRLFVRVHNRSIINMAYINQIDNPNNRVILQGHGEVGVSRRYKSELERAYLIYQKDLN